ncbi:succinylglutamate desuccinylase/aspartoacylase family protein [Conexibacter sp. JD483]|uniref:succinylglutamate desuccinylase/aspartoacylase family protein n=1 Tax=unclassified Conexibacter TaxID=2627773 RepID=UPI00271D9583|nr:MULTISPECIES: succinylglutamate desuccinylase/aspartoacylase family protein [unclassified Conexibacter]MDO8187086.1 succinylglutamate desuccinylase/aspartoacylase family protein [Conexibacter sp. CPCC 205706]MDO8200944.1 succinylglutamate desuccinylase/aspartoacylase family protein [Conexibacter sp. CPCC 205762]MDR9372224.1 succinylglutamate desuccinylase/aspartoacylase family protein [Conexibacter sp. JD483]
MTAPPRTAELTRHAVAAGAATLPVDELRGGAGPVVVLLGGVHGDEPEGVLAVRRIVAELRGRELRGSIRALAVANPLAHAADARCTPAEAALADAARAPDPAGGGAAGAEPDGGNLARAFPGDAAGGPTARLAAAIMRDVLVGADLLIDLHSAGRAGAMPLFCGFLAGGDAAVAARSRAAAEAFAAPLTWAHDAIGPGRTLSAAATLGIPAIYAEAGGGGEVRGAELDALVGGTLRALASLGMLPAERAISGSDRPRDCPRGLIRGGDGDLDASLIAHADGLFITRTHAGAHVRAGDLLGEMWEGERLVAPRDGIVMFLRRDARVAAGDSLALIAPPPALAAPPAPPATPAPAAPEEAAR